MNTMKMMRAIAALVCVMTTLPAVAQFDLKKAFSAGVKAAQAVSLTDEQMAAYVGESVAWMDANNKVAAEDSPYTVRLRKLTAGLKDADGIPLNFKVYEVTDVNAFACADGSVRVFSSLMDIMTDDELLGVIGHEIGHVALRHSKKAFKTSLMTGALLDCVSSTGGKVARLTDSQLGAMSEALVNARFSQKQEREADNYGFDFLKSNNRNPWCMSMSFRRLQQMEQEGGAGKQNIIDRIFASHPDTEDRIKAMEERAESEGFERP